MKYEPFRSRIPLKHGFLYGNGEDKEPTETMNFVVFEDYFLSVFPILFPEQFDPQAFLKKYNPITQGERIYQRAKEDHQIIEEYNAEVFIPRKHLSMDDLIRFLYRDHPPAPRHGHCGRPMFKDAQGYYYCKHCEEIAREEADRNSELYRLKEMMQKSCP